MKIFTKNTQFYEYFGYGYGLGRYTQTVIF